LKKIILIFYLILNYFLLGNEDWISMDTDNKNAWICLFHGTSNAGTKGILDNRDIRKG